MEATIDQRPRSLGIFSMICGGIALLMVMTHLWAGPLQPQKSIERTIAETAVNISKEVVRGVKKKPAVVRSRSWTLDDVVRIVAAGVGVLALVLAAFGFVKREDNRPLIMGLALGGSAIAFQLITWLALLIAGLVFIWIVTANLGDILSGLGGG